MSTVLPSRGSTCLDPCPHCGRTSTGKKERQASSVAPENEYDAWMKLSLSEDSEDVKANLRHMLGGKNTYRSVSTEISKESLFLPLAH